MAKKEDLAKKDSKIEEPVKEEIIIQQINEEKPKVEDDNNKNEEKEIKDIKDDIEDKVIEIAEKIEEKKEEIKLRAKKKIVNKNEDDKIMDIPEKIETDIVNKDIEKIREANKFPEEKEESKGGICNFCILF